MVAGAIRVRGPPEDEALRQAMHKVREQHARHQQHDYSHVFRPKTRFELIRLCCIIVGIEFAYSAETAFVSPTLLAIGIHHSSMTMVWSLSPILGFFLAPLMGSLSDRCTLSWGRRRPLLLILSVLIFTGLILVPWGKNIGTIIAAALGDTAHLDAVALLAQNATSSDLLANLNATSSDLLADLNATISSAVEIGGHDASTVPFHKWAAIVTILGTICLDFSADTCQTPARTYMLDTCISEDHAHGLSIFTVLAGFGGFMGYSLGGINWEQTFIGQLIGSNVKTVFTIVTVLFLISCCITMFSFREIPLKLMEADELLRPLSRAVVKQELERNQSLFIIKESSAVVELDEVVRQSKPINNNNEVDVGDDLDEDDEDDDKITLREYLMSIVYMPRSMQILCLTNLLSWMAHLSYSLYFTDFVGESVFGGNPAASAGTDSYELYQSGVRFGCWGMAIYALSCSLYSMTIEKLIKLFGAKVVYIGGLLFYSVGMIILAKFPTKVGVLLFSISAGIIYATLFTLPYLLLANYHASGSFKMKKGENVPLKKKRGLGTDVAVISSMMFVAQIIISLTIGSLIALIGTSAVIYAASFFSLLAALMASQVLYMDL